MEMLEMKNLINQILKKTVESTTNKLDQAEERISGIEDKVAEILYPDTKKENK
jgi:hypothetical protein